MIYKLRRAAQLLCLAGLTVAPLQASAEMPVTYVDEGRALFGFSVPDFWLVRSGGQRSLTPPDLDEARLINRVIGLEPAADSGVWMGFMSPHGVRTFEEAVEYLRDIGPFIAKDGKETSRKRVTIGGLPAASIAGTGRRDGRTVNFTAVIIDLPGPRVAIALTALEAGADPAFVGEFNRVFSTFRAVN